MKDICEEKCRIEVDYVPHFSAYMVHCEAGAYGLFRGKEDFERFSKEVINLDWNIL